jgi:hypothetical protein
VNDTWKPLPTSCFYAFYQVVTACYAACYRSARPPVIPAGAPCYRAASRSLAGLIVRNGRPRGALRGFRLVMSGNFPPRFGIRGGGHNTIMAIL